MVQVNHPPSPVSSHILAGLAKGRHQLREKALGRPQNGGVCVLRHLTASLPPSPVLRAAPRHLSAGDHRRCPCLCLLPAGEGPGGSHWDVDTGTRSCTDDPYSPSSRADHTVPTIPAGGGWPRGVGWTAGADLPTAQAAHFGAHGRRQPFTESGALLLLLPVASWVTVPAQLTPDEPTLSLPSEPSLLSQPVCGPILPHLGGS